MQCEGLRLNNHCPCVRLHPSLFSTLILREEGFKVTGVLMPIYLHLLGTNPSVHSQTISVNHRLVSRTTAACHNGLSNEAVASYQSRNEEGASAGAQLV